MLRRLYRAWCLYIGFHYSWHVAWHKAGYRGLQTAPRRATHDVLATNMRRDNVLLLRTAHDVLKSSD